MDNYLIIAAKILMDYGISDMVDGMRVQMLAMDITNKPHTVESLKETSGFLSTVNDINFTDEYLQELIDFHKSM